MAKKGKTLDGTIIDCMDGVLAEWFPGDTWMSWRSILKGAFAIPMTAEELDFFSQVAEREPPQQRVRELWVVGGRRGGKDSIASLIITYIAAMFDGKRRTIGGVTLPALRRGERGTIFCLARDRDQAAIALDYVKGFFVGNEAVPELRQMVVKEVRDGIQLANGVDIIVGTNDFRGIRGRAVLCAVLDEVAFYKDETSATPDFELFNSLEPGMKTLRDQAMIIGISSAHKKSGLLYSKFQQHYSKDDPKVLVVKATSMQLNPTLPAEEIEAEIAADPDLKAAEYLCVWRTDISSFVSPDVIDAATIKGATVIEPQRGRSYIGFIDVSGGVSDSHALAISFRDDMTGGGILSTAREIKSPDTESVVREFAATLKAYGLSEAYADGYGKAWVVDAFGRHGIKLKQTPYDRSTIYLNVLPALNSGQVKLLDLPRLRSQFLALERRTIRGTGRDKINHPSAGHDDLCNVAAGSLVLVSEAEYRRNKVIWSMATEGGVMTSDGKCYPPHGVPYTENGVVHYNDGRDD
jgi:hypothetical protein